MTLRSTEQALAEAKARFVRAGRPWSDACVGVMKQLLAARAPVKAYALGEGLGTGGRPAYPATVYRALTALEQAGLVHRIASLNAFTACTGGDHGQAVAFLICDRCGSAQEAPMANPFSEPAAPGGFEVRYSVAEFRGFCRTCSGGNDS